MTDVDALIEINGSSVEIWRNTGTVEDDYGDIVPIWGSSAFATEIAWIQSGSSVKASGITSGIAGEMDESDYLGVFKSDSVVQRKDITKKGGVSYEVKKVEEMEILGFASHHEAWLVVLEEGE